MVATMGSIDAIWIKRARAGPMDPAQNAELIAGHGIAGNANQGGRRQVTLIEREAWEAMMAELSADLPTSTRRANLVVSSFPLIESRGRELRIGECVLRVTTETRPCELMDQFLPGLKSAMSPDWRGGASAEVVRGGTIAVGDRVEWIASEPD
jgi:MOSC domain-containing protein YiiM